MALLPGSREARAQTRDSIDIRALLRHARSHNWHVRVFRSADTVQGRVPIVRDTAATIGGTFVPYSTVHAVQRR
jgi:hypothetical protein